MNLEGVPARKKCFSNYRYDGFGLAWGIGEYILNVKKSYCLFATHFHEVTAMSKYDGVKNYHVTAEASNDSVTMLYN